MQEEIEQLRHHLSAALDAAEEAEQARNEFLATVAHEIRTPIASILGYVDIFLEEANDELSEQQREYLHIIRKSGEHVAQLIDDLRDLDEVVTGDLTLTMQPIDPGCIIEDVRGELYPIAEKNNLALRIDIREPLPPVRADEGRLRQVLVNLVSNALKFTDEGSVVIEAVPHEGSGETDTNPSAVIIRVKDSGIGIHPDFLPQVFDRFAREKRADDSGSGLGLTISKELIERMNGTIEVESTLGEGSIFTVYLPTASSEHSSRSTHSQNSKHSDGSRV